MKHENDEHTAARLHELLSGEETSVRASAEARERSRIAFLTGERVPAPGEAAIPIPRVSNLRPFVSLALAAAVATFVLVFGNQPAAKWSVVDVVAPDGAMIEGLPAELHSTFASASGQTLANAEVDLQLEERIRLKLMPESQAEFPKGPGRWFAGSRVLRMEQGEVCGTTAGQKLGFKLVVETPEARAEILGTTFAVSRDEDGTCVSLYKGAITVTPAGSSEGLDVSSLQKLRVFRDGRPPALKDLEDRELLMLQTMLETGLAEPSR